LYDPFGVICDPVDRGLRINMVSRTGVILAATDKMKRFVFHIIATAHMGSNILWDGIKCQKGSTDLKHGADFISIQGKILAALEIAV
jgi:hypothetical protein